MKELLESARACRLCAGHLPLGPRPILRGSPTARMLIVSQAPGTKVHISGTPWTDASGHRLRAWLNLTPEVFYDEARIGILPMGLCYPGVLPKGGDKPPRPECAPLWHPPLLAAMPAVRLILLAGGYAQSRYLGPGLMTERVRGQPGLPRFFCLPHPSWRTVGWAMRNPWFETETLPILRDAVSAALR